MANDSDFVAYCRELLSPLGAVRVRRMFGGHGLYVDERFIAIISADLLYLKADDQTRAAFESAGCLPFVYDSANGRRTQLGYWQAPDEAMDSAAQMLPWARLALGAALRAGAQSARRRTRPSQARPAPNAADQAASPRPSAKAAARPRRRA